jgi:hypothetical protein
VIKVALTKNAYWEKIYLVLCVEKKGNAMQNQTLLMQKMKTWARWYNHETAWGRFARKHRKGLFIALVFELVVFAILLAVYHHLKQQLHN